MSSLFDLDEQDDTAQPNLATGYEFTNSTTLKVIVPSGLTFSDKSALTVADVVYSFEQAKNSPAYGSCFRKGFAPPRQRTTTPWCLPCATPPLTGKIC